MLTQEDQDLLRTLHHTKRCALEQETRVRELEARLILSHPMCTAIEAFVAKLDGRSARPVSLFLHQMARVSIVEQTVGPRPTQEQKIALGDLSGEKASIFVPLVTKALWEEDPQASVLVLLDPLSLYQQMSDCLDDQETFDSAVRQAATQKSVDLDAMIAKIPPDVREDIQREYDEDPRLRELLEE